MPFGAWPTPALALTALLASVLLADALRRADWRAPLREHLGWAGATFLLVAARQMTITLPSGLTLQYLGAAWLTLLLGYPRAVVSLALILFAEALVGHLVGHPRPLAATPPLLLLLGILPAWLIWQVATQCRRRLPPNLFVFLLGVGFFGLYATNALSLLLAAGLAGWLGGPVAPAYWQTVLPYALLLATGESWLEGMMTTLLVAFVPGAVRLFDESYYLAPPRD